MLARWSLHICVFIRHPKLSLPAKEASLVFVQMLATFLEGCLLSGTGIKLHLIGFESIKFLQYFLLHFHYLIMLSLKGTIKVKNFQTFKVHTISSNLLLTFSILFPGPDSLQRPAKRRIWWNSTQLYMLTTLMVFPFYEKLMFCLTNPSRRAPRKSNEEIKQSWWTTIGGALYW